MYVTESFSTSYLVYWEHSYIAYCENCYIYIYINFTSSMVELCDNFQN